MTPAAPRSGRSFLCAADIYAVHLDERSRRHEPARESPSPTTARPGTAATTPSSSARASAACGRRAARPSTAAPRARAGAPLRDRRLHARLPPPRLRMGRRRPLHRRYAARRPAPARSSTTSPTPGWSGRTWAPVYDRIVLGDDRLRLPARRSRAAGAGWSTLPGRGARPSTATSRSCTRRSPPCRTSSPSKALPAPGRRPGRAAGATALLPLRRPHHPRGARVLTGEPAPDRRADGAVRRLRPAAGAEQLRHPRAGRPPLLRRRRVSGRRRRRASPRPSRR